MTAEPWHCGTSEEGTSEEGTSEDLDKTLVERLRDFPR